MNTFVIILIVLVLVAVIALTIVGATVYKMMKEARRAKSIWHGHTSPVTSLSVHLPVPAEIMTKHQLALLNAGCTLVNEYGGPSKKVKLTVLVTGRNKSQVDQKNRYTYYAYEHGLTGAHIDADFIFWRRNIEDEVTDTLRLMHQVNSEPPSSVHVVVCSSPRVALLRAVWERTYGTPETWFYVVDGAPIRMWIAEAARLSLYYVARGLGKLRRLAVPIIDNQAAK